MKARVVLTIMLLVGIAGLVAWWLWVSPSRSPITSQATQIEPAHEVARTVELPKVQPVETTASTATPPGAPSAAPTLNPAPQSAPTLRLNGSWPFHFQPDNPAAHEKARVALKDNRDAIRLNIDTAALTLDSLMNVYELSDEKLGAGAGLDSAAESKGQMRYLARDANGLIVANVLVYPGSQGGYRAGAQVMDVFTNQITQALNELADLASTQQGNYEARLLISLSGHPYIWLKSSDGHPNLIYESNPNPSFWLGSRRLYTEQDFISLYLNKLAEVIRYEHMTKEEVYNEIIQKMNQLKTQTANP